MRGRESIKPLLGSHSNRAQALGAFQSGRLSCCKVSRAIFVWKLTEWRPKPVSTIAVSFALGIYGRLRMMYFLPMLTSYILTAKDCPQHLASRDSSVALTVIDLHPVLTIRNLHI